MLELPPDGREAWSVHHACIICVRSGVCVRYGQSKRGHSKIHDMCWAVKSFVYFQLCVTRALIV